MSSSNKIIWLASYPKSGNTWFRIVLSQILNVAKNLHYINDINTILGSPMVTERTWINALCGFDTRLLSHDEMDQMRPEIYQWYAKNLTKKTYIKIHDAYTYLENGKALIPEHNAIYFIRNPLDVAVSLAHHAKCPIDWSIQMMGNSHFSIPLETDRDKQIRQKLCSWSGHVQSWLDSSIKPLVLRYEDMLMHPLATFEKGFHFLNIALNPSQLEQAIKDTSFDKLQQHEAKFGFHEKPSIDGQFFRKGIAGDWKNQLNAKQVRQIVSDHADVMRSFGYINDRNEPF